MQRAAIHRIVLVAVLALAVSTFVLTQDARRRRERHAAIGQTVRLRGHVNYHPCGSVIPTTISIDQPPQHGTLAVRDEMITSGDPEFGGGDRCQGHSGQGKAVYYTRTSPGSDQLRYTSSSANGEVHVTAVVD
jgi:hypothetical protein